MIELAVPGNAAVGRQHAGLDLVEIQVNARQYFHGIRSARRRGDGPGRGFGYQQTMGCHDGDDHHGDATARNAAHRMLVHHHGLGPGQARIQQGARMCQPDDFVMRQMQRAGDQKGLHIRQRKTATDDGRQKLRVAVTAQG